MGCDVVIQNLLIGLCDAVTVASILLQSFLSVFADQVPLLLSYQLGDVPRILATVIK